MAESPFYIVKLEETGRDITGFVTSFRFEESDDSDDKLSISITDGDMVLIDSDDLKKGNTLIFSFGLLNGIQSKSRIAIIKDAVPDFGSDVTISVNARDAGFAMKKDVSNNIYKNKTASQIVQDLAKRYGYTAEVDATTKVYTDIAQGNKTFFDFCKELAEKEGTGGGKGAYEFYAHDKVIYFKRRDFSRASTRTYVFRNGDGNVRHIGVNIEEPKNSIGTKNTGTHVDKDTGKVTTITADTPNKDDVGSGKKTVAFDYDANIKDRSIVDDKKVSGHVDNSPAATSTDLENKLKGGNVTSAANVVEIELDLELDPQVHAGDIITVLGIGKTLSGNYKVRSAIHSINNGDDGTTVRAVKNATGKALGKELTAQTQNNTTGSTQGKTEKSIGAVKFDANGKRI